MNILRMIAEFQQEMQATTSGNAKKEILEMYKDSSAIQLALHYTYSPFKQFGVSSKQCAKRHDLFMEHKYDIIDVLEMLASKKATGHDAIRLVNGLILNNEKEALIIYCMIDKDLKLRANTSTINKVIPFCIPTFEVALAEKFDPKYCDFENDQWLGSRKLDGVRCIIRKEHDEISAHSRQGKEFHTLQRVLDEVAKIPGDFVLDGEICMMDKDGNEDFQSIMKQIRKKDHTIDNPKFVIFDYLTLEEFDTRIGTKSFEDRYINLQGCDLESTKTLTLLEQTPVDNETEFQSMVDEAESLGYEGIMLRKNSHYRGKRSRDILKVKKMHDAEYVVTGATNGDIRVVEEGVEKTINCLSSISVEHKGNLVGVGSGFSLDQRKEFGDDHSKIVGKTITVQYFEESKNQDGKYSLRFPVIKHVFENGRNL